MCNNVENLQIHVNSRILKRKNGVHNFECRSSLGIQSSYISYYYSHTVVCFLTFRSQKAVHDLGIVSSVINDALSSVCHW